LATTPGPPAPAGPGCLRDGAAGSQVLVDAEPQTAGGGQPGQRRVRGGKGPGRVQRRANAQLVRRADERDNRLVRLWLTGEERAHLVSALTKIHRAAAGILAAAGTAEAARDELSRTASW
jgi:hypothetical protein